VRGPARWPTRPRRTVAAGPVEDRTRVVTAASVPGWLLRAALALVTLAAVAAVAENSTQLLLGAALALGLGWRPVGALAAVAVAFVAGMLALVEPAAWQPAVLVLGTHALLRLAAIAGAASWTARVELGVLRAAARPFVGIQALAQALALAGGLLGRAAPVPWLAVAAAVGLLVVAWATLVPMVAASRK
jgi:hypothetical protein